MPGNARVRNSNHTELAEYTLLYNGGVIDYGTQTNTNVSSHCEDVVGNFGGNNIFFHYEGNARNGCTPIEATVSGGQFAGSTIRNSWPYSNYFSHVETDSLPGMDGTTLAARTNPSRPDLTPLTWLQDIYDVPRMLAGVGKLLSTPPSRLGSNDLANHNLAVRFGWIPLISDVHKVLQTQGRIEKRYKRLRHLYDSGGERRHISIGSTSAQAGPFTTYLDGNSFFYGTPFGVTANSITTKRSWATARWQLNADVPRDPSYTVMNELAWKVANGLTPEGLFQGAWDLMPWSWLVDWFTNIGSHVANLGNSVPASFASGCTMEETKTITTLSPLPSNSKNYTSGGGSVSYVTQRRTPLSFGSISASFPCLSAGDVSVLGSLFVQRFKR